MTWFTESLSLNLPKTENSIDFTKWFSSPKKEHLNANQGNYFSKSTIAEWLFKTTSITLNLNGSTAVLIDKYKQVPRLLGSNKILIMFVFFTFFIC
jgi:hypothetical protein